MAQRDAREKQHSRLGSKFSGTIRDEPGFILDEWPGADTLFVGAAGFDARSPVPNFNWRRQFEPLPVSRLYIRDFPQQAYQRGVPGLSHNLDSTADRIHELMAAHGLRRLVCVGACAGGLAALVLGQLLRADEVHVFSPVTMLPTRSLPQAAWYLHTQQTRLLGLMNLRLIFDPRTDRRYYDLAPLLSADNGKTRFDVHYSARNEMDARWAERIAGLPRITLHAHDSARHPVTVDLKGGELEAIIAAASERVTDRLPVSQR